MLFVNRWRSTQPWRRWSIMSPSSAPPSRPTRSASSSSAWRRCGFRPTEPSETFWEEPSSENQSFARPSPGWYLDGPDPFALVIIILGIFFKVIYPGNFGAMIILSEPWNRGCLRPSSWCRRPVSQRCLKITKFTVVSHWHLIYSLTIRNRYDILWFW